MVRAFGWRFGLFIILILNGAGLAQAYTRAYIVNNTGQAAFSLHVKLTQAALANSAVASALSGQYEALFGDVKVSADGMTLDFNLPLDPSGIVAGQTVWLGWTDADPNFTGQIASYYFTGADGSMIGNVQYPAPDDTGALTPSTGTPPGILGTGTGTGGGDVNPNGGPPTGTSQTSTLDPGSITTGGNTPPTGNGGNNPAPTQNGAQATPEPLTFAMLAGGLVLMLGSRSIRRRN